MPSGDGFIMIEQYRNLAKGLTLDMGPQSTCGVSLSLDQEVPQTRSYLEDFYNDMQVKSEVREPQQELCPFMENIFGTHDSYDTNSRVAVTSRIPNMPSSVILAEQWGELSTSSPTICKDNNIPTASVFRHSTVPSAFSSPSPSASPMLSSAVVSPSNSISSSPSPSASPMLSSAVVSPSNSISSSPSFTFSSHLNISRSGQSLSPPNCVKMSSYVTELGGSGCVVMTKAPTNNSTDFLTGESFMADSTPNFLTDNILVPEDDLDYLDLDKQPPVSFYGDLKLTNGHQEVKSEPSTAGHVDSLPLEEAVIYMRDVIHHDCDFLNVPYDPILWNADHVCTWVSWVCQREGLTDIFNCSFPPDGRSLCAMDSGLFRLRYGQEVGDCLSMELELWKAANSCFPEHQQSVTTTSHTPSVSPVPSVVSEHSQAWESPVMDTSDHSDDDSGYSVDNNMAESQPEVVSEKCPVKPKLGRGHKQTIHLWQFLRELLQSKENNGDCIRWLDRNAGVFKIEDSKKVASLWGLRKNRPAMNYDKLSRSVRQYYKKKIIKKTEQTKRLVYQFCPGYL